MLLLLYRQWQTICSWLCRSERTAGLSGEKKYLRIVIKVTLCYSVMLEDLIKPKLLVASMAILSEQGLINNCRILVLESHELHET